MMFFVHLQRIFPLLPTAEEKTRIEEERLAYPDIPLASAEQFLLTISSVNELQSRLKLWQFSLEYETIEKVKTQKRWLHIYSTITTQIVNFFVSGCRRTVDGFETSNR
jgi:hypothetical protein